MQLNKKNDDPERRAPDSSCIVWGKAYYVFHPVKNLYSLQIRKIWLGATIVIHKIFIWLRCKIQLYASAQECTTQWTPLQVSSTDVELTRGVSYDITTNYIIVFEGYLWSNGWGQKVWDNWCSSKRALASKAHHVLYCVSYIASCRENQTSSQSKYLIKHAY